LQAVKILNSPSPFKLLITGRSAGDVRILQLVEELELKDKVTMTGHLPHEELIIAMSAADILVEPKIDHAENQAAFPQKIVEYLAMGKPIVASAVGDLCLYLHDQENALLCGAGDLESLAKTLERLMADADLRKKLAINARKTAVQYFDCRKIAARIEEAFLTIKKTESYSASK
jgi:glycosyltransferase involved in cell wall biosynthesis